MQTTLKKTPYLGQFIARILMKKKLPGEDTIICVHTGNPGMVSLRARPGARNLSPEGSPTRAAPQVKVLLRLLGDLSLGPFSHGAVVFKSSA